MRPTCTCRRETASRTGIGVPPILRCRTSMRPFPVWDGQRLPIGGDDLTRSSVGAALCDDTNRMEHLQLAAAVKRSRARKRREREGSNETVDSSSVPRPIDDAIVRVARRMIAPLHAPLRDTADPLRGIQPWELPREHLVRQPLHAAIGRQCRFAPVEGDLPTRDDGAGIDARIQDMQ